MSRVIDLTTYERGGGPSEPLQHPAGVTLPLEGPSDAALIIPEIRSAIRSGAYDADMIALLDEAVRPSERVLVVGAGLGVLTTLIAKREGVERVIAVEANTQLVPYLDRTHALNGAEGVETVNAVLAEGKTGRVPFFARRDIRTSSLLPHDRSWQQVMMIPFMDLNLILAEERISLVVSEIPAHSAELIARAELESVEHILLSAADDPAAAWEDGGVCALLVARGYVPEVLGTAALFRRSDVLQAEPEPTGRAEARAATSARDVEGTADDQETDDQDADDESADDQDTDSAETAEDRPPERGAAEGDAERPAGAPSVTTLPMRGVAHAEDARASEARGAPDVPEPEAAAATVPPRGAAPETPAHETPEAEADARTAPAPADGRRGRLGWTLVALALLLALPLMLIGQLAAERGGSRSAAVEALGAAWGGPQILTGPFVMIPVRGAGGDEAPPLVVLPESVEVLTRLETEMRREGAFKVPLYLSESEVRLAADLGTAARLIGPGETALWTEASLALGVSDPKALGQASLLGSGPEPTGFEPGTGVAGLPGIRVPLGDPRGDAGQWGFVLDLKGSGALRLTPAGGMTLWRLHADWPHPDFAGDFPPAIREVGKGGFVAEWRVPEVAHGLPRAFRGPEGIDRLRAASFGVELTQPVDVYRTAQRAAKFGLLVIALSFGAVFLIERSAARTARVAHYALIGIAQCTFFLLLLALAERIGLGPAYALASVATVALLSVYAWLGLGLGPRAGWVTLALVLLYGAMYPVLLAQDYVLITAAVLAFLVIAGVMWGTTAGRGRYPETEGG